MTANQTQAGLSSASKLDPQEISRMEASEGSGLPPAETREQHSWLLFVLEMLQALRREGVVITLTTFGSGILAAVIVLLLPQYYRASSTLLVPPYSEGAGLGMLSSLAGKDLGSLLQGKMGSNPSLSTLETLLQSRSLGLAAIERFGLDSVWEVPPRARKRENLLKAWWQAFDYELTFEDALVLSFEDRDPKRAAAVVDFVAAWIDSAFQANQRLQARRTLSFIESRLQERKALLSASEDSLVSFQLSHNAFAPGEQLKRSIIQAASLESQVQELEIKMRLQETMTGPNSSEVRALESLRNQIRARLAQMTKAGNGKRDGVFKRLGSGIQEELQFERLSRQVLAHGQVYQFLMQQSEQLGIEKLKDIPVLSVIDPALPPQKRSRPPRQVVVQAALLAALLVSCVWAISKRVFVQRLSVAEKDAFRSLLRARSSATKTV